MRGMNAEQARLRECKHCAQPLSARDGGEFCCMGCRVVHGFLTSEGLHRFYAFRPGAGVPVRGDLQIDDDWCEAQQERIAGGQRELHVAIDGMHCSACSWLIEALFRREKDARSMELNAGQAVARLQVGPQFDFPGFASRVRRAGYRLCASTLREPASDKTLTQIGISGALFLNIMILAIARYLGLAEEPLASMMLGVETTLAFFVLLVGLGSFGRTSLAALRTRTPHLDAPIAVGMVLSWSGSTFSALSGREAIFFDSFAAFVTLMLVGRWLQRRIVTQARAFVQNTDDVGMLRCKRKRDKGFERICFRDVATGDTLVVGRRDVLPTRARIKLVASAAEGVSFSLAWATGESRLVRYHSGDEVPAGAICESEGLIAVESLEPFSESTLPRLLQTAPSDRPRAVSRLARWYLISVLLVGTLGFAAWWTSDGPARAIEVATAFFVVTCPCVFGVVVPLARSLTQARLRTRGIFVRSEDFLERLAVVDQIALDKTGTLTAGTELAGAEARLGSVSELDLRALRTLATLSSHPKARVVEELLDESVSELEGALPSESAGRGIELLHEGSTYFLGRAINSEDLVFSKDEAPLATFSLGDETLTQEAHSTLTRLRGLGHDLVLLSGDSSERAANVGQKLGFEPAQVHGGLSPEQKRDWLKAHGSNKTLYVGDGVNDVLAADVSSCSIAPAQTSSFVANRTDAFWVRDGLAALGSVVVAAKRLYAINRNIVLFAVLYNVVIGSVALSGKLLAWQAAVVMPVTSLLFTAYALMQTTQRSLFADCMSVNSKAAKRSPS